MPEGYLLSQEDRDLIQEFLKQNRGRSFNTLRGGPAAGDQFFTSDIHVAKAPVGGIPARSGNTPGKVEDVQIYRLGTDDILAEIPGLVKTIHNLSTSAIAEDEYVRVVKDKFGEWYAELGSSSDGGTGGDGLCEDKGWWAGVRSNSNLAFSITVTAVNGACSCVDEAYASTMTLPPP